MKLLSLLFALCCVVSIPFLPSLEVMNTTHETVSAVTRSDKPLAPLELTLSIPGPVEHNQPFDIQLTAKPYIEASNTRLQITLPEQCTVVAGDLSWQGTIAANSSQSLNVTVILNRDDLFAVEGSMLSQQPYLQFGKTAKLFIDASVSPAQISESLPDLGKISADEVRETRSLNKRSLVSMKIGDNKVDIEPGATEPLNPGELRISGFFRYRNFIGDLKAAKYVLVEFWDADVYGDDLLGTSWVSPDGYFESDVLSNDDEEGQGQDIFLRFRTDDLTDVMVIDGSGHVFSVATPTRNDVPDGWLDLGDLIYEGGYTGAFEIFDYLENGWSYWYSELGYDAQKVTASWYPGSNDGTYVEGRNGNRMHIVDGDQMDEDVILHEYGHSIMYDLYGRFPPDTGDYHIWSYHYHKELAWSEGWATFASCIVHDDQFYRDTTDQTFVINIENAPDGHEWNGGGYGNDTESAVCGLLWDIYDSHNDNGDVLSDGPANIFNAIRYYKISAHHIYTIDEFWYGWFNSPNGRNGPSFDNTVAVFNIFSDHGVIMNHAPTVSFEEVPIGWVGGTINISAKVNDTEGDSVTVSFFYTNALSGGYDAIGDGAALSGNTYEVSWDTSKIIVDETVQVMALASDGFQTTTIISEPFAVDNAPPVSSIVQPGLNDWLNTSQVEIRITGDDLFAGIAGCGIKGIWTKIDNADWVWESGDGLFIKNYLLSDGYHTVSSQAEDNVGNRQETMGSLIFGIDTVAPVSSASSPNISESRDFAVTWNGTDFASKLNTSGLKWYDVQYKDGNKGSWQELISQTTEVSVTFRGQPGHTYYFRSRAWDNAGNVELLSGENGDSSTYVHVIEEPLILTVDIIGGGELEATPKQDSYIFGDPVQLTVTPNPGWTFSELVGDNMTFIQLDDHTFQLIMEDNYLISAIFKETVYDAYPGDSFNISVEFPALPVPSSLDILLLQDETSNLADTIANLKAQAPQIWDSIASTGLDFRIGIAGFRDFAQGIWSSSQDWVYRLVLDMTSDRATFLTGVKRLNAGGGVDKREATLEALHYLCDTQHPAIDSNGDGDTNDVMDTPAGKQPTWRADARKIVVLLTDAPCHTTGDAGGWPGDDGTINPTVTANCLRTAGITLIGITPSGPGILSCIDTLAKLTNGTVQAMTVTGAQITNAIAAGINQITTDVWAEVVLDTSQLHFSTEPLVYYSISSGDRIAFEETIDVFPQSSPGLMQGTVNFYAGLYPSSHPQTVATQPIRVNILPTCVATAPDFTICQGIILSEQLFLEHGVTCPKGCSLSIDFSNVDGATPGTYQYSVTIGRNGSGETSSAFGTIVIGSTPCAIAPNVTLPVSYTLEDLKSAVIAAGGGCSSKTLEPEETSIIDNHDGTYTLTCSNICGSDSAVGNIYTGQESFTIQLNKGWNLISLPYHVQSALAPGELLTDILDQVHAIYSYVACKGVTWNSFIPGGPDSIGQMRDGHGYWLLMDAPATLQINGLPPSQPPDLIPGYEVCPGWNLIGFSNGNSAKKMETYLDGTSYGTVLGYDSDIGAYFQVFPGDMLEPGHGYWVNFYAAGVINPQIMAISAYSIRFAAPSVITTYLIPACIGERCVLYSSRTSAPAKPKTQQPADLSFPEIPPPRCLSSSACGEARSKK